jgi:hypothetical protein
MLWTSHEAAYREMMMIMTTMMIMMMMMMIMVCEYDPGTFVE